jgi:hypothetical protein
MAVHTCNSSSWDTQTGGCQIWGQPRQKCETIYEKQINNQDAPLLTDKWIKKMQYLYTMEFYSAMKKNEILSFSSKWMEWENIILSEVSQAQKTKNSMFSLICRL